MRKKKLVFTGLGFPIELIDVPMVKIQGELTPDIDLSLVEKYVLTKLARKEGRLSGDEIRFIRLHRQMTLQDFGVRFGVTHPAVKKWESARENGVNANWSTEKDIRMFAVESFSTPVELADLYKTLEKPRLEAVTQPIQVRVAELRSVKDKFGDPVLDMLSRIKDQGNRIEATVSRARNVVSGTPLLEPDFEKVRTSISHAENIH